MFGISVFFLRCRVRVCVFVCSYPAESGSYARACVSAFVCACVCSFSVAAEKKKRRRKKWPEVAEQAKPGAGDQREAKKKKESVEK